jgi:diguanylate cyclase
MLSILTSKHRSRPINPFVLANYRVRTASFVMAFVIFASQWWGKQAGPLVWALLLLQFFVYPHVMFWRARRAAHALDVELKNLLVDTFLLGLWCAGAGLPVWITFTFFSATLMNVAFYRNLMGALQATLFFVAGVLIWDVLGHLQFAPTTNALTTGLCIMGLLVYMMIVTSAAYQRSIHLRETRRQLRSSEQALNQANTELQAQLAENQKLQTQLKEQANRDPLTGLYNRRYLDSTLARELAHAKREGHSLWLMLIDIDHFKNINDRYGHQAGDEVIKSLARLLHDQARVDDIACRFGGEEFLLLLPNMTQAVALARAEQWRQAFADTVTDVNGQRLQATLSIGMADYPMNGLTPEDLIGNADRALYRAKSQGRNCVIAFSKTVRSTPAWSATTPGQL